MISYIVRDEGDVVTLFVLRRSRSDDQQERGHNTAHWLVNCYLPRSTCTEAYLHTHPQPVITPMPVGEYSTINNTMHPLCRRD